MASNLLLCSLLDSDKLIGPNFDSWYRKLKIVLEHERILYLITDPAPEVLAPNTHDAVRDTYQKWLNDRIMMQCIMRAMMNDNLVINSRTLNQKK